MRKLPARLKQNIESGVFEPQVVVEIDGLPTISSNLLSKLASFDDPELYFDTSKINFDGSFVSELQYDLIDIKRSTNQFTQQLQQGKGGFSSVTTYKLVLIDFRGIVSKWITPGAVISDIMGTPARIYLNYNMGIHPNDSVRILSGIISGVDAGAGFVTLTISSPEERKRSEILTRTSTKIRERAANTYLLVDHASNARTFTVASLYDFPRAPYPGIVGPVFAVRKYAFKYGAGLAETAFYNYTDDSVNELQIDSRYSIVPLPSSFSEIPSMPFAAAGTPVQLVQAFDSEYVGYIELEDASGLRVSTDESLESYVQINDEIIRFISIVGNEILLSERGCFGTTPAPFTAGDSVESIYRVIGNTKDLALKLMLSGDEVFYATEENAYFVQIREDVISNAIIIDKAYLNLRHGISPGDQITIDTESLVGAATILDIGNTERYTYFVVDKVLVPSTGKTVRFRSRYNTLPDGLGMMPDQVDIAEHEKIFDQNRSRFFTYEFVLTESINAQEFINTQLYYPVGCYSIPRNGGASIGMTRPPIAANGVATLDETNVINPGKIVTKRSLNQDFYNSIIIRYDKGLDGKYYSGKVRVSGESRSRIKVPNRPLVIDADGVRTGANVDFLLDLVSKRFLNRLQFGVESFEVPVLYLVGMAIEVGDTVVFDGSKLGITDITNQNGTRIFKPRAMEVTNKKESVNGSELVLTLSDTGFSVGGRYGVVGPSSWIGVGSTASRVKVERSFGTIPTLNPEKRKWEPFINELAAVRSEDWTTYEEARIVGFDPSDETFMLFDPPISFAPSEGMLVDSPRYGNDADPNIKAKWKATVSYLNPQLAIVDATTRQKFSVSGAAFARLTLKSVIMIHDQGYNLVSEELTIKSLDPIANEVELSKSVAFDLVTGMKIELIGYLDGGGPYRII